MTILADHRILEIIKDGARAASLQEMFISDFESNHVVAEYSLSHEIGAAFVEAGIGIVRECHYKNLFKVKLARSISDEDVAKFGAKRMDVAVQPGLFVPRALIEVKINVRRLTKVTKDLGRLMRALRGFKLKFGKKGLGISLFQVSVRGTKKTDAASNHKKTGKNQDTLDRELTAFEGEHPDFHFDLVRLEELNEMIEPADRIEHLDGSFTERRPHASGHFAILVKRLV